MGVKTVSSQADAANPLGYEKEGKLLVGFAIPCIISMLVTSLYNIVDQIFIGQGVGLLGNAAILRRYAGCFALRRGLHSHHSAGVSVPHYEYRHEQADSGRRQPALFHDVDAHRRTYQYGP